MLNRPPAKMSGILLGTVAFYLFFLVWIPNSSGLASTISPDTTSDGETALTNADKAIVTAKQSVARAAESKAKISEANKGQKADQSTAQTFSDLSKYLKENISSILKNQKDSVDALTAQKQALVKARAAVEALNPKPAGADDLIARLKKKEIDIDTQNQSNADAGTALEGEAKKAYSTVEAIAKDLSDRVAPLADDKLASDAKSDALLTALPMQFPILATAISLKKDIDKNWPSLDTELKKVTTAPATLAPASAKTQSDITAVLSKLPKWLATIQSKAEGTNSALADKREALDKDLQANLVAAIKLIDQAEQEQSLLADLSAGWALLANQIKDEAAFTGLKVLVEKINKALNLRPERTQLLREGLAGNYADFVPDFVQLYYFTDALSLMKALNPVVKEIKDASALRDEATRQRRALDDASLAQSSAQQAVNDLQTRVRDLEQELEDAQRNAATSAMALLGATRHLDELNSRPNPDAGKIKRAELRKTDLETEDKGNQATLTKLSDESAGLPKQIETARNALIDAQKLVRDRRIAMISLTQVESDAFAKARDNEPVYYTEINVGSKDPLKQIQIYAFGSRKVIYLRGTRENVGKAKDIIALFDRPAPQARLNLWTLELNSTANSDGAKKFNKALSKVENELSNTRTQIAAALSYLRDCINDEVNAIAIEKLRQLEEARRRNGDKPEPDQSFTVPQDAEDLRWARMYFYQKEVLMRLGFDPEKEIYESRIQSNTVNFNSLPDPAGTTTLGEALVILSLANAASRHEVMTRFSSTVDEKLEELKLYPSPNAGMCNAAGQTQQWFASTTAALGAGDRPYYKYQRVNDEQLRRGGRSEALGAFPLDYAYTSMQKEIVGAITLAQIPRLINRLRQLQQHLANTTDQNDRDNIQNEAGVILKWLYFSLGVQPDDALTPANVANLENIAKNKDVLRTANAKVARTDLMLRQMINAVDEDMDRQFVRPMMSCLREQLISEKGISVGILNRTSVLATNRLMARVDARSSAQLSVGEEQDVLAGAQQLASLYLSAQTGGLLGGLNALGGIPQKQTSEVYGLNSGSMFKVTPIFDPTGQALRFQFDYSSANLVTDPDGSISPQLPRIERHTVNTEVELNNLELREISRFNSNSRLGIPTTIKGGIPIIKDIPGMKYVPLLGWFVRRSGKSAVIQQSLMFGQTTMYPTIADLFDLLSGEDYNSGDQACPSRVEVPKGSSSSQHAQEPGLNRQAAEVRREITTLQNQPVTTEAEKRQYEQQLKELSERLLKLEDALRKQPPELTPPLSNPGLQAESSPQKTPPPSENPGLKPKVNSGRP